MMRRLCDWSHKIDCGIIATTFNIMKIKEFLLLVFSAKKMLLTHKTDLAV